MDLAADGQVVYVTGGGLLSIINAVDPARAQVLGVRSVRWRRVRSFWLGASVASAWPA